MKMLDYVLRETEKYVENMPKSERKKKGQFFTSRECALFMAGMFDLNSAQNEVSILDPGAGSGILSAALIERMHYVKSISKINIVLYENDDHILNLLKANTDFVCKNSDIEICYEIIEDNYILSQSDKYNCTLHAPTNVLKFDYIIGNPPYKKIGCNAPEARAMHDICYGAPNLYFLFAEMSLLNLKENGELVYILPRSWTSGIYFKKFRRKFLNECVLECIHYFENRSTVFDSEDILQEIMILKARKTQNNKFISISTSNGSCDLSKAHIFKAKYNDIIYGDDKYVYLAKDEKEIKLLNLVRKFKNTLSDIGLKMKTGPVVDFRNKNRIHATEEQGDVPLFCACHIKNGEIQFPCGNKKEYLTQSSTNLLLQNSNYLFVKRFTTKEEKKRLQCAVFLSKDFEKYKFISADNKINYICGIRNMSECVVYGLYVLFNSTIYDSYYRMLNGTTQVNATEINDIPVPCLRKIEEMGKAIMKIGNNSVHSCDTILMNKIY